jgi:PncC family amidohydrolase
MSRPIEVILGEILSERGLWLAVAESSTGGKIGKLVTDVPGSSTYFKGGVIAYANEVKAQVLGVRSETLDTFGAVSEETVLEMANGVRVKLGADIGLSVSGIAGPGGGTDEKPIGTTWIGMCTPHAENAYNFMFNGDRHAIREQTAQTALKIVVDYLSRQTPR